MGNANERKSRFLMESLNTSYMKKTLIAILALVALGLQGPVAQAQDMPRFKRIVRELSRAKYQGRGYARDGVRKAREYVIKEFERSGVDEVTVQPFTLDINTFSGKMNMWADGRRLKAGIDFSMREHSPGVKGEFPVYYIDTTDFNPDRIFEELARPEWADAMVCCDFLFTYKHREVFSRLVKAGECTNRGVLYTWAAPLKFYKAYGEYVVDKPIIWVTPEAISGARKVRLDIENKFLAGYQTENVIAKVKGRRSDSCFVFTAHYDHLGNQGRRVFYPGANDNASGVATILTLARYFAERKPDFDMYFVAFSGEEANLRGSTYFAEHPAVPLEQIRFLYNIDMIGDDNPACYCELSDAGLRRFPRFEAINDELALFDSIARADLAANSDHYPFAVRGVPCIFLMNEKGSAFPFYHTPNDNLRTVKYDSYGPVFRLVTASVERYDREPVITDLKEMNIEEVIASRHAVRKYKEDPVPEEVLNALREKIHEINRVSGLHVQLVTDEPKAFKRLMAYGSFSGVRNYFIMAGPKSYDLDERVGYYGEQLVLLAQTLGLNTCWAGQSYKKVSGTYALDNGEKVGCYIAFGYGQTQGNGHRVKPLKEVSNVDADTPAWFRKGVEMALLAPTAFNQQKFYFEYKAPAAEGERAKVATRPGSSIWGYTKMDLGIAKLHFELGAGCDNFDWE